MKTKKDKTMENEKVVEANKPTEGDVLNQCKIELDALLAKHKCQLICVTKTVYGQTLHIPTISMIK